MDVVIMVHGCVCDRGKLEQRIFWLGSNLTTHCSVFVQLCLRKTHLFSGVEGSIQSANEEKGEGLGVSPRRAPAIFNCWHMMAKQYWFRLLIQFCCRF